MVSSGQRTGPGQASASGPDTPALGSERYLTFESIGEGGMGTVYRAYDTLLNRAVALKVVRRAPGCSDRKLERLHAMSMQEAQALARISHPNVVAVYDVGGRLGEFFMTLELVEGTSLGAWLDEAADQSWRRRVALMIEAARGLAAAHERGLVHRDVKPDNLLIGADGHLRVVDFGLAVEHARSEFDGGIARTTKSSLREADSDSTTMGTALDICGTPAYMSPEQHLGSDIDARADQFSLCATFYEAFFGVRPFVGKTLEDYAQAKRHKKLQTAGRDAKNGLRCPGWLRRVLVRGLSWHPEDRHTDLDALIAQLESGLQRRRRAGTWAMACAASWVVAMPTYRLVAQDACGHGDVVMAEHYSKARVVGMKSAFAGSGRSLEPETRARVFDALEGFSQQWRASYRAQCEARRNGRLDRARTHDARAYCLQSQLTEFEALAKLFDRATPLVVTNALRAARELPEPAECADIHPEHRHQLPPSDEATRQALEALEPLLAEMTALERTGEYGRALAVADEVAPLVAGIDHPHLQARYAYARGSLERGAERAGDAAQSLAIAITQATRAGDEVLAARASISRVFVVGYLQGRTSQADEIIAEARAHAQRASIGYLDWAQLYASEAALRSLQGGRAADTYDLMQQSLALAEATDPYDINSIMTVQDFGVTEMTRNQLAEAERLFRVAIERQSQVFGVAHPNTARTLHNLGTVHTLRGAPLQAIAIHREGLAMLQQFVAPSSPRAALGVISLAHALIVAGDRRAALDELTSYQESAQAALSANLVGVEIPMRIVILQATLGEHAEARSGWRRLQSRLESMAAQWPQAKVLLQQVDAEVSLQLGEVAPGDDYFVAVDWPPDDDADIDLYRWSAVQQHNGSVARLLIEQGDFAAADELSRDVLERTQAMFGPDNLNNWPVMLTRVRALAGVEQLSQALELLAQTQALIETVLTPQSHLLTEIHELRGDIERRRGHRGEARRAYLRALELFDHDQRPESELERIQGKLRG